MVLPPVDGANAGELAHVGLTEAQAKEKFGDDIRVLRWSFEENDRARAELQLDRMGPGSVTTHMANSIVTGSSSRVLKRSSGPAQSRRTLVSSIVSSSSSSSPLPPDPSDPDVLLHAMAMNSVINRTAGFPNLMSSSPLKAADSSAIVISGDYMK